MKTIFYIAIFTVLFFPMAMAGQVVDKIAVLVDDKIITEADVEETRREAGAGKDRNSIIWDLINNKVIEAEVEKENISIPEQEIDRAVSGILKQYQITLENLKKDLLKKGTNYSDYREGIRQEMVRNRFLQKVIYPRIRVSDYDLQEYYKKNMQTFSGFEKVRFLEILLTPDSVPPGRNLAEFASHLAAGLKAGASFSETARKYSRGAFAEKGGDSGFLDASSIRPDLANVLMTLKPNTVSDPFPAGDGFFILKVVETSGKKYRPFKEVKDALTQSYMAEKVKDELERFVVEARSRHFIEIR